MQASTQFQQGFHRVRPAVASRAHRPRVARVQCRAVAQTRTLRPSKCTSFAGQQIIRPTIAVKRYGGYNRRTTPIVEANLFSRLFRVVKAYVDSFVGSFEDPEKLLDRLVEEMTQDSIRLRQASAQAIASQRQMKARADNVQATADQWLRRAELAVKSNQDDLAREALSRRKTLQTDADRLKEQATAQQQAVDQLTASVKMLENKIAEARGKKETLKARAASAKSSLAIQEMIGGLRSSSSTSFAAFEKMEEKVMALEAEAESVAALTTPDSLEARFNLLETGGVEEELAALKRSSGSQAALPRPPINEVFRPNRAPDSIDMELEELRQRARQ